MHFRVKRRTILIFVMVIFSCVGHLRAEGRGYDVIEQVSTHSEENVSSVLIKLTGYPAHKVIPVEDREMLVAFKDTELSGDVYASETIVGDKLVKGVEITQKACRVVCVLVKTYKPYREIEYQVKEGKDLLCIEIRTKSKHHEKGFKQSMSPKPPLDELTGFDAAVWTDDSFGANGSVRPGPGTDLFLEAAEFCKMGKWEKAIPILEKVIQSYPESRHSERAYFLLAKSFHGKFEKEIPEHLLDITAHYEAAIKKFPESDYMPGARVSIGNCYLEANQYHQAMTHYDLVRKENKDPRAAAEALLQRGRVLAATRKPLEALQAFEELQRRYPKTRFATKAKIEVAKTFFDMKSFKRSLRTLTEITKTRLDEVYKNSDVLLYTGNNYCELGRLQEARDAFSKVLNYFPELESADLLLTRIADTYREEGLSDEACKLYDLVARTYPEAEGGLISLLRLAAEAEKAEAKNTPAQDQGIPVTKTAHEIYEQIIEEFPDNSLSQLAMLKLANIQQKDTRYEQSIKTLKDLLAKHPATKLRQEVETSLQQTLLKLALVQKKNGDYEKSVLTLREILVDYSRTNLREEIKSELQASLETIFERKRKSGEIESIVSYYEKMKSSLPFGEMGNVLLLLGEAHKRLHLYGHALLMFSKAGKFSADKDQQIRILLGLGESAYKVKKFDEAEGSLKDFVTRYPGHREASNAYYWLGSIFLERRQYEPALESLRAALGKNPERDDRVKILTAMAKASNAQGHYENGVRSLKDVVALLSLNKGSPSEDLFLAYRELGETYVKLGQKEKAVPVFKSALELGSKRQDIQGLQFRLAQCYQWVKATSKAQDVLNQIVASGDPFWSKVAQAQINEINIKESVDKFGYGLNKS
jgi:TolA-binding protein